MAFADVPPYKPATAEMYACQLWSIAPVALLKATMEYRDGPLTAPNTRFFPTAAAISSHHKHCVLVTRGVHLRASCPDSSSSSPTATRSRGPTERPRIRTARPSLASM